MDEFSVILARLATSKFRRSFALTKKDMAYIERLGLETITSHARDFIGQRLAAANPKNDGKQTPFRGHPVFVAQHATATCCRGCLLKWHRIPKNAVLDKSQNEFVVGLIMAWIKRQFSGRHS